LLYISRSSHYTKYVVSTELSSYSGFANTRSKLPAVTSQPAVIKNQATIPLGLVFMSLGAIILVGVLLFVLLQPLLRPKPFNVSSPPAPAVPQSDSPLAPAPQSSPTHVEVAGSQDPLTLLPENRLIADELTQPIAGFSVPVNRGGDSILAPENSVGELGPAFPLRLVIPAIEVDAPIEPVGLQMIYDDDERYMQWEVPRGNSVGWHNSSASLGEKGNTVLNGHNNIHGNVFKDLADLTPGDEVIIYDSDRPHVFQVTKREILKERGQPLGVREDNARWIEPSTDERITLVSCWPPSSNSHRLIVVAEPIENRRTS
jgi:LPXTG-site transpeptidase (sortase) family protein